MGFSRSIKHAFANWILAVLKENKATIENGRPNVTFDVDGNIANLEAKEEALKKEIGKVAAMEAAKIKQVKLVNDLRNDYYKEASSLADSISGFIGKKHSLSVIIHQKRDSMFNRKARGKKKNSLPPKKDNHSTPTTDIPTE